MEEELASGLNVHGPLHGSAVVVVGDEARADHSAEAKQAAGEGLTA
jgi:hypothetical protein